MGGMQVLEWASRYSDRVFSAIPIATAARHSSQNSAFHEVGRQAVMADPDWLGGRYYEQDKNPRKGWPWRVWLPTSLIYPMRRCTKIWSQLARA